MDEIRASQSCGPVETCGSARSHAVVSSSITLTAIVCRKRSQKLALNETLQCISVVALVWRCTLWLFLCKSEQFQPALCNQSKKSFHLKGLIDVQKSCKTTPVDRSGNGFSYQWKHGGHTTHTIQNDGTQNSRNFCPNQYMQFLTPDPDKVWQ